MCFADMELHVSVHDARRIEIVCLCDGPPSELQGHALEAGAGLLFANAAMHQCRHPLALRAGLRSSGPLQLLESFDKAASLPSLPYVHYQPRCCAPPLSDKCTGKGGEAPFARVYS